MITFQEVDHIPEISYIPVEYLIMIGEKEIGSIQEVHKRKESGIDCYAVHIFDMAFFEQAKRFKTLEEAIEFSISAIKELREILNSSDLSFEVIH